MQSLLTSNAPDRYNAMRQATRRETKPVAGKYKYVLALHLSGKKVIEISELTGYKQDTIYKILNKEEVIGLRQQLMAHLDKEFEAQYEKVINVIERGLDPQSPQSIQLQAAKLWGDYHKKFQPVKVDNTINLTAEDIVFNIMNGNYSDGKT